MSAAPLRVSEVDFGTPARTLAGAAATFIVDHRGRYDSIHVLDLDTDFPDRLYEDGLLDDARVEWYPDTRGRGLVVSFLDRSLIVAPDELIEVVTLLPLFRFHAAAAEFPLVTAARDLRHDLRIGTEDGPALVATGPRTAANGRVSVQAYLWPDRRDPENNPPVSLSFEPSAPIPTTR